LGVLPVCLAGATAEVGVVGVEYIDGGAPRRRCRSPRAPTTLC
jgi:hypothetical protein